MHNTYNVFNYHLKKYEREYIVFTLKESQHLETATNQMLRYVQA